MGDGRCKIVDENDEDDGVAKEKTEWRMKKRMCGKIERMNKNNTARQKNQVSTKK